MYNNATKNQNNVLKLIFNYNELCLVLGPYKRWSHIILNLPASVKPNAVRVTLAQNFVLIRKGTSSGQADLENGTSSSEWWSLRVRTLGLACRTWAGFQPFLVLSLVCVWPCVRPCCVWRPQNKDNMACVTRMSLHPWTDSVGSTGQALKSRD